MTKRAWDILIIVATLAVEGLILIVDKVTRRKKDDNT